MSPDIKAIYPKLRFPEFTDEWQVKKLGAITEFSKSRVNAETLEDSRFVGVDCMLSELRGKLPSQHRPRSGKVTGYVDGDILHSNIRPYLKKAWLASGSGGASADVLVIHIKNSDSDSKFIYYQITSDDYFDYVMAGSKGVKMPRGDKSHIMNYSFKMPKIDEQEKIAAFLTAVDERIGLGEQQLEQLQRYKRGVMQKIFSQQVRFKDDNGNNYPDWEEKKAGALFTNISNRKHNGDLPVLSITQDGGVVRRDSLDRKIDQSDAGVQNYKIIEPNDFVISLRSFQGGIEMSNILGISSPAYTVLRGGDNIVPGMFKHYFKRDEFISKLNSTVIGIRDGKQISYEPFSTIKLPVPSIPEQQKIADFLSAIDEKITAEQTKLTAARQFKKALLQRMFV